MIALPVFYSHLLYIEEEEKVYGSFVSYDIITLVVTNKYIISFSLLHINIYHAQLCVINSR